MTIANDSSIYSSAAPGAFRKMIRKATWRLGRLVNNWIAALIAQREYQAQLTLLRSLTDRELRDIGLDRSQIGEGLAEAAQARSRVRQSKRAD
jgi:uncharacterized protein YjiS (DUF1127 family)